MSALSLNTVIGNKYRIERMIGAGGMGEVFRAMNLQTKRPVAVKVLSNKGESGTALLRFRNEAVIQHSLRHPNVAELYEYFESEGKPCIAMELVEGSTLAEWIRERGAVDPPRALEILADICDAVSYMHSKGTIHRDIKSENIRINPLGKPMLLDFGISFSRETPTLTRLGFSIGTPEKMAPEQHRGLRGDARSDVWSLGVLLYEMVTGTAPFVEIYPNTVHDNILALRYVPAEKRNPGLPKGVARLIHNCLCLKPEERYASGGVLLREVQHLRRKTEPAGWKSVVFSKPALLAALLAILSSAVFIYAFKPLTGSLQIKSGDAQFDGSTALPSGDGVPARAEGPVPVPAVNPRRQRTDPAVRAPSPVKTPAVGSAAEEKVIRVATYDGPAEVVSSDGRVLGLTPFPLKGTYGANYELWLRRPGFEPRKIGVQINNKSEYLFGLEKAEDQSGDGNKE